MYRTLSVALIGFSVLANAAIPPQEHPESHHYGDWDKGYSITMPEKWNIKRDFTGLDIFAAAPPKSALLGSRANMSVFTVPMPEDGDLNGLMAEYRTDLDRALLDFKVLETGQVAFYGFNGRKIEFTSTAHNGDKIRTIQYYLIHNNHALIITYAGDYDEFPRYLSTFEKQVRTLKFH